MDKIRHVYTDDWEALYINNDVMLQNHSLPLGLTLEIIADKCKEGFEVYSYSVPMKCMKSMGWSFPKTFDRFIELLDESAEEY